MGGYMGKAQHEWREIEAQEHDEYYSADRFPFGLQRLEFTVEHALWYEDYCYKKGRRRDRGHRTQKFLNLVDLESLEGKRVLDIGSGIGQYSVLCAKKGAKVVGVELSKVGVGIARQMAVANSVEERCEFVCGDFTEQEFPEDFFDVVMLHEVLHHAIKYDGLKEQIATVTRTGGKIVIADTVRGGGAINLGRKLVKFFRYRNDPARRERDENLGDVLMDVDTYEAFADGFSHHELYLMSYFFMIKQTWLKHHLDKFFVRWFLRMTKYADDILLTLFPFLRRACGEAVLYIEN